MKAKSTQAAPIELTIEDRAQRAVASFTTSMMLIAGALRTRLHLSKWQEAHGLIDLYALASDTRAMVANATTDGAIASARATYLGLQASLARMLPDSETIAAIEAHKAAQTPKGTRS